MTNNTNKNFFNVNFFDNTISGSVANFKKASKGSGAAYEELCRLMKEHKGFKLVEVKPKKHINRAKRVFDGMDRLFIKDFITFCSENPETLKKEFEEIEKLAKATATSSYPLLKRWFLKMFNTKEHPFDMAEAKALLATKKIEKATAEAAKAEAKAAPNEAQVLPLKETA